MIETIKKTWWILALLLVAFVALRVPAVDYPYHQDEYKWVQYSHPEIIPPGTVPHPPLTEFLYTRVGPLVGDDNFRTIPLTFSIINFFLLFWLSKILFKSKRTALWTSLLFTILYYSVLASVMVDVDGTVMPFFLLLMAIGYYSWKDSGWKQWKWGIVVLIGVLGSFMIKISGLLPVVAFALDFAIEKQIFKNKKKVAWFIAYAIGAAILLVLILLASRIIFPFFNLSHSLTYWQHFAVFGGRGWMQTFIQFAKGILYTSPLLIIPAFLINREIWARTRAFFLFLFIALFFYLIAFDFSLGALDRYFQFFVVPLSIISGAVFSQYFKGFKADPKEVRSIAIYAIVGIALFLLQYLPHAVPPLYPKTEWIARTFSFKWNYLFPFMGGSGPLPFYVSFLFMAVVWVVLIGLVVASLARFVSKRNVLLGVLIIGIAYNAAFIQEYLFGRVNGSAQALVKDATQFIAENPEVTNVTVYNDNGGFNVMQTGKYLKRLYIDPKFDAEVKKATLNQNKFFYMVVDIPHIDESTMYAEYFASCKKIYSKRSGVIGGFIYDCRQAPDLK